MVEEKAGENTNEIVVKLAKDIGVDITVADISTSHRLPGRRVAGSGVNQTRGGKTSIAKFVRRDVKVQLMRSKNKLKSCDAYTTEGVC